MKFLFLVPRDVSVLQRTGSMKMHMATHIFSKLLTKMAKYMTVCNLVNLHICVEPAIVYKLKFECLDLDPFSLQSQLVQY